MPYDLQFLFIYAGRLVLDWWFWLLISAFRCVVLHCDWLPASSATFGVELSFLQTDISLGTSSLQLEYFRANHMQYYIMTASAVIYPIDSAYDERPTPDPDIAGIGVSASQTWPKYKFDWRVQVFIPTFIYLAVTLFICACIGLRNRGWLRQDSQFANFQRKILLGFSDQLLITSFGVQDRRIYSVQRFDSVPSWSHYWHCCLVNIDTLFEFAVSSRLLPTSSPCTTSTDHLHASRHNLLDR